MLDEMLAQPAARGLILRTADDVPLDGRVIEFDGRPLINFGSCSYLGLEMDRRMREAVCEAVMRYGTQFSSSRSYVSAPLYAELEARLAEMFGGHVLVAPSTSLGHLAALPVLVGPDDAVLLDQQVHHSVQMAANQLRVQGTTVDLVRHNDLDGVERAIEQAAGDGRRIWYLADGVYSMFADYAPLRELAALLDRHEHLYLYMDDSHGVGWTGRHGRGPTLEAIGLHDRVVVAASLNKSFAAAGGALIFADAEDKRRVRTLGGPMMFSGPVQPPMLGAALASVAIHLAPELEQRQAALRERIQLCTDLMEEHCLPLATHELTPIRYVTLGLPEAAQEVAARLIDDGIYVNLAMFPAVPMKKAGVRLTLTLHHRPEDVRTLVEALARHVPAVLASTGAPATRTRPASAPARRLELEHCRSISELDGREWDRLLGDRGTFNAAGLGFLEQAFADGERPEDRWEFDYFLVRDGHGTPVLATFFTAALWKDDMLAPSAVSRRVEERRLDDAYYLTSRTYAMGSLLTEGDHLYLDRGGDWRAALDLLVGAVEGRAAAAGAQTIVLRDLAADDEALTAALRVRGFVKVAMPRSLAIESVAARDAEWLASLSSRARAHQRREVIPWDSAYEVEVLCRGRRVPDDDEFDHLHGLYRSVRERNLDLNTFELPRTLLRDVLAHPCWELVLLYLRPEAGGRPGGPPVAFGAHFVGERHYAPMIVGLDYEYVRSHHSYRQALRQSLLRARAHGSERILLGIGADLEKRRFGATTLERCAFAQASDHYGQQVIAAIEADALRA